MSKAMHKKHNWVRSDDQTDVGTTGVRLICDINPHSVHVMTVHFELLDKYL